MTLETFPLPPDEPRTYSGTWGDPRPGGRRHRGVDIIARDGAPILAATSGRVVSVLEDADSTCGLGVQIVSGGRLFTYCHMRAVPIVHERETVEAGDLLGHVGETGDATAPHLHFQVQDARTREYLDPLAELRAVDPGPSARARARGRARRARGGSGGGLGWLLVLGLVAFVYGGGGRA